MDYIQTEKQIVSNRLYASVHIHVLFISSTSLSSLDLKDSILLAVTASSSKLFQLANNLLCKKFEQMFNLVCDLNRYSYTHLPKVILWVLKLIFLYMQSLQWTVRPPLVYYLFPVPIFSKTEVGGRWLLIIYYANEPIQNVVHIRFNNFLNRFHYHCNV